MRLHTAGMAQNFRKPIVARLTTEPLPVSMRKDVALVLASLDGDPNCLRGYAAVIVQKQANGNSTSGPLVHSVREIDHLRSGHVVALEPQNGFIRTLYRPESPHNT